jgi:hypothetical protein
MSGPTSDVWGELPIKGGVLRVRLLPGDGLNKIRAARFSGPFTATPDTAVLRLEEELAGVTIDEAPGRIEDWFQKNPGAVSGVEPGDLLTVLSLAHMKVRRAQSTAPDPSAWKNEKST